jgi:hypothetical protein
LWRDTRISEGKGDPVTVSINRVPAPGLISNVGLRFLFGSSPRPGDIARVRAFEEIAATLDTEGALDSLPFMPEMKAYCGQFFRVHRRLDKINDMRHKTGLRRLSDAVTLTGLRCSGAQHDG